MAQPTRILFVAGEVEPFAKLSDAATLVRTIPEQLQEIGDFETRIMMPRYGLISERKNRLHEVIRLSGTEIPMGEETETLKVKVASIPGIRLQVYFMDNVHFFKRKGLHTDKQGHLFEDNAERALFFGRSVVETLRKLMWKPDVIHAFGWISGLLPLLLHTEYAEEDLFENTKVIYTPDGIDANARLSSDLIDRMALSANGEATGLALGEVGLKYADAQAFLSSMTPTSTDAVQFSDDADELAQQAMMLYETTLSEVAV
jgi:starch synthase